MLEFLVTQLKSQGLEGELVGPGLLLVRQLEGDAEADVSLSALRRRLDLSDASTHLRITTAFAQRIAAAFGIQQPLREADLFPRILPSVEDKSLSAPWKFEVSGGLQGVLVQDQGVNLRLLPPLELVRTGKSLSSLQSTALANLRALPVTLQWEAVGLGRAVQHGDGFMAARALVWDRWQDEGCWIGLPSRDELWLWSDAPTLSCQQLLRTCYQQAPYSISGVFWFWTPEAGIQPWMAAGKES